MIIELENFGIIKHFTFDTKNDFNLIFGKNNTGKSYAISAVYLIIKNILNIDDSNLFRLVYTEENSFLELKVLEYLDKIEKLDVSEIKEDIEEIMPKIYSELIIKDIQESFKNTFDSIENLQNQLCKESLKISIKTKLVNIIIKYKEKKLYIDSVVIHKKSISIRKVKRNLAIKDKDDNVTIYCSEDKEFFKHRCKMFLLSVGLNLADDIRENIKNIYYLPASRSGLYQALSAFGQIIVELSKSRKFTTKKLELPSISEPLSDYFLELSNIKKKKRESSNNVVNIAYKIERDILNGEVNFDNITKKLIFKPNETNLSLDLSYTSSMVSELSPIVSYLKYIINNDESVYYPSPFYRRKKYENSKYLIIIEEPEAHLHPDIQTKLISIFSELVNENVKFIMTTHSNFMFNKFNNLILGEKLDIETTASYLFKITETGTEVIQQELDEFGIEDENFIYTSEDLYNERMKIIDKKNSNV